MATTKYQIFSSLGACGGAISIHTGVPSVSLVNSQGGGGSLSYIAEHYDKYQRNIFGGNTGVGGETAYLSTIDTEYLCYVTKSSNSLTGDFVRGETVYQPQANHPSGLGMTAYVSYWDPTRQILGLYDVGSTSDSVGTGPTGPMGSTGATGASSGWSGGQISGGGARWEVSTIERLIEPEIFAEDVSLEHWGVCGDTGAGNTTDIKFGASGVFKLPYGRDLLTEYTQIFDLIQANHNVRIHSDTDFISTVTLYDRDNVGITMSATGGGSGARANHGISAESEFNDFYFNFSKQIFDARFGSNSIEYYRSLYLGSDSVRKINTTRGL